jgi:hypothetical protein
MLDQITPASPDSVNRNLLLWIGVAVWLITVGAGISVVWAYDNTPGVAGHSPARWPSNTRLTRATDRATVVLLAHPQCSCTRATLQELGEVLAHAEHPPRTYVVFLKPSGFANGWEMTELWNTASRLPGVTAIRDDDGREATHFGAATSGQTLLYDAQGTLLFSGGITGARGEAGDNAGEDALIALLNRKPAERTATSVFGCPLFSLGS